MNDFFHGVLMQLPAQVSVLKGPDHIIELINPPAQDIIGNRNLLGMSAREALPEIEGQGFFEILDKVYQTGETFSAKAMSATILRNDQPVQLYFDVTYLPFRNKSGNIEGVISFTYDVTEAQLAKKKLEEALEDLKQSYDDLEVKVKFRTLELEKSNLELQQKLAVGPGR